MGGRQLVTLDKLPLKRVLALEENGTEHFPPEPTQEEKPRLLIQRLELGQALEKEDAKKKKTKKKSKSSKEATVPTSPSTWPWQNLVDHLQQAQQELSIILDFLTNVETNETITVASMVKPKPLLHEACSDLALRASVKLHDFKKVGKYLKQNAKALEQQVEREAIFYGALMRLQRNWKIKRLRTISAGPGGNAGFSVDLSYPFSTDVLPGLSARTTGLYTVNIEQDSSGLLATHLPGRDISSLRMHFGRPHMDLNTAGDAPLNSYHKTPSRVEAKGESKSSLNEQESKKSSEKCVGEGVDEGARIAQSVLRRSQAAIFDEQIYEWVVREALQPSSGVVVAGICDNNIELSLGHAITLIIELVKLPREARHEETIERNLYQTDASAEKKMETENMKDVQEASINMDMDKASEMPKNAEAQLVTGQMSRSRSFPHESAARVYLLDAFFQNASMNVPMQDGTRLLSKSAHSKMLEGSIISNKQRDSAALAGAGLRESSLSNFGGPLKNVSAIMHHRVCAYKVSSILENLIGAVPHLLLFFHPTWHPLVTAWDLKLDIPHNVVPGWKMRQTNWSNGRYKSKSKFQCSVLLRDTLIFIESLEFEPIQDALKEEQHMCKYSCCLSELSGFILYQIAGQLVRWLYEEALAMGLKVRRDLLSIFFHLNGQDDIVIVASLDMKASCINWWILAVSTTVEGGLKEEITSPKQSKRFLGPLSLETLKGIVIDLLNLSEED